QRNYTEDIDPPSLRSLCLLTDSKVSMKLVRSLHAGQNSNPIIYHFGLLPSLESGISENRRSVPIPADLARKGQLRYEQDARLRQVAGPSLQRRVHLLR